VNGRYFNKSELSGIIPQFADREMSYNRRSNNAIKEHPDDKISGYRDFRDDSEK
jgi:hypothetical protein